MFVAQTTRSKIDYLATIDLEVRDETGLDRKLRLRLFDEMVSRMDFYFSVSGDLDTNVFGETNFDQ